MYVSAWQGLSPQLLLKRAHRNGTPLPYPLGAEHATGFHVARNGFWHLMKAMGIGAGDTVLMPSYHSTNEVLPVQAVGAHVEFFSINKRLEPDLEELEDLMRKGAKALILIQYIGWAQPMDEILALCEKYGVVLVEDCALSLLSKTPDGRRLGSMGDYSIFCLYKTLPLPNGALLVQNRNVFPELDELDTPGPGRAMIGGRIAELHLEWLRGRSDLVGGALFGAKKMAGRMMSAVRVKRVPVGDMGFNVDNVNLGMADYCRNLLWKFDYDAIVAARRRNWAYLEDRFNGKALLLPRGLEEGMCPLFYTVCVPDKDRAVEVLQRRGVMATPFWNYGVKEIPEGRFPETDWLRRHVLELPIHQDVSIKQLDFIADEVLKLDLDVPV